MRPAEGPSDAEEPSPPTLIPWTTSSASSLTYRLAVVATLTAAAFEAVLLFVPGMIPGDHAIIAALIAGSFVAAVLARTGRNYMAAGTVIGALWLCAVAAVVVHGIRAAALPSMVMAVGLAALWGGAGLAVSLIAVSCLVLVLASGALGELFPPPAPTDPTVDLIVIVGQFVFLGALAAILARALRDLRSQFVARDQKIASATQELAVSQSALQESSSRYAELVRAHPDLIVLLDESGHFLEVNDASRDFFGRNAASFLGRRMGELGILAPPELDTSYAALRQVLAGETLPPVTLPVRHADGSRRWMEVTSRLLVRPSGERRVLLILRDVTARVASEEALGKREALWQRASRIAQLGAWEVDLVSNALTWDDEIRRLHETPPDFVPNVHDAMRFYAPEARPVVEQVFERLVREGTSFSVELPLITAKGRRIYVRAQGEAEVRDGQPVKAFGFFQDITVLHDATERLRETAKLEALGRLAGGVAHDFNNLLTAILGYTEEVELTLPPGSAARDDVVEIRRAGERARELTMQLLAFARRQVVVPKVFDVAQQLQRERRFLERLVGEDVELQVTVAPDAGTVRMDPSHFEQLLLNLAINARDAMPRGGALRIHAARVRLTEAEAASRALDATDCVEVEVTDTGVGMSPEVLARVFEPFFTTKELGHGTGLGLATAYGVARQAGGHIAVRSVVGEGTTFTISLPRSGDAAAHRDDEAPREPRGGTERLLLVEDDVGVRTFAERVLRQAGYDVRVAALGAEALLLADLPGAPPQLLVTDVVMPGMSGPELADRLERRWPALQTLFVSGYAQERLNASRLASSASFLPKPYTRQQLLEAVRHLLDGSGATALTPPP